jgi:hypothetical protein
MTGGGGGATVGCMGIGGAGGGSGAWYCGTGGGAV